MLMGAFTARRRKNAGCFLFFFTFFFPNRDVGLSFKQDQVARSHNVKHTVFMVYCQRNLSEEGSVQQLITRCDISCAHEASWWSPDLALSQVYETVRTMTIWFHLISTSSITLAVLWFVRTPEWIQSCHFTNCPHSWYPSSGILTLLLFTATTADLTLVWVRPESAKGVSWHLKKKKLKNKQKKKNLMLSN